MSGEAAIRCGQTERTYPELQARVAKIAGGLRAVGVRPGDKVALVLRNSVEFLEASAAVTLCGGNPVPVNWHWQGDELRYLLTDSGGRAVFAHTEFVPAVTEVLPDDVPLLEVVLPGEAAAGSGPELESWLAREEPLAEAGVGAALGVIYTSGTTGRPKGIVREQVAFEKLLVMAAKILERMGLRPGGSTLVPAPLYHTAPNTLATITFKAGMDITVR